MINHLAALKEHIASYYTTDAREEIAWAVAEIEHLTRERDEWAGVAAERNREIANLRSDIAQLRGELSLAEEGLANFAQSAAEPSDDRADAREDLAYYEGAKAALVIAEKKSPATAHAWVEGGCGGRLSQARAALKSYDPTVLAKGNDGGCEWNPPEKSKAPLCDCDAECVGPDARADKLCRAEEGALRTTGDAG